MLKRQLCITGINYILQYIQIEKLFSILMMFHNITDLTVLFRSNECSLREQTRRTVPTFLNVSVCAQVFIHSKIL